MPPDCGLALSGSAHERAVYLLSPRSDFVLTEAGDLAVSPGLEGGDGGFARGDGVGAPRVERAAGGRVDGGRRVAGEHDALAGALDVGIGRGNSAHQGARVGMLRALDDVGGGAELDDLAEIHDGDAIGDVFHDRKIMGDEDETETHLFYQLGEKVQDLRLDGDVEGGDGFVGDDDLRPEGEGAGDGDALALAAGEFMRVFLHEARREADGTHEIGDACGDLAGRAGLVHEQGLGERGEDRHAGVERGVGILKNHLQVSADAGDFVGRGGGEVAALEDDGATGRGHQLHDGAGEGGFTAARFAHEPDDFAPSEGEVDAIDGFDGADGFLEEETLLDREVRPDIAEFEDGGWGGHGSAGNGKRSE